MAESTRGSFIWHELLSADPAGGQAFYTALVGWGTLTMDVGAGPYTMFTAGEVPVAGSLALPEEAKQMGVPPHWVLYVSVEDVDATVAQATGLGAQTDVPAMDIPTVGRMAVLTDPQGAGFAVFTPSDEDQPQAEAEGAGTAVWHELATSDPEAAIAFYAEIFGWQKTEAMDMGDGQTYQMYGNGGDSLGGIFKRPPEAPVSAWNTYWEVADVDAAAPKIAELGGQVLNGPMEVPGGGRVLQGIDPQGAMFSLHSAPGS